MLPHATFNIAQQVRRKIGLSTTAIGTLCLATSKIPVARKFRNAEVPL